MKEVNVTVDIAAAPERVWDVMRDVERWPEWTPSMERVQRLDGGAFAVGSRVRIKQPSLPPSDWQVTALEQGRGFVWASRSPGVRVRAEHWIEPARDGSRVTLSLQFSGPLAPLVARLGRSLIERYVAMEANGLRERSEESGRSRRGAGASPRAGSAAG